ncbi:uncharacterized protein LOC126676319 [Mercurialis annua]|uniref:uncharacterized protein LOC126676319 n=1 Tax=Mercurialis annua TaxID=3986 RepID=UPI00215DEA15|nr:uncharacterized protein LOC126676319 [Mercurialis annua]
MYSPCAREVSEVCFHGCCTTPFHEPQSTPSRTSAAESRYDFELATVSSIHPNSQFTNHESLPSLEESFFNFTKAFSQYPLTDQADKIRQHEYHHLCSSDSVSLDYIGHGLFSYSQQETRNPSSLVASTSASPPPPPPSEAPFFDISCSSARLTSQLQYGGPESDLENQTRKRIMAFMNISEDDYTLVFTANQSSAFKLVADSYPFQSHRNLLTVYDYESEAVNLMIESSKRRGSRVMSAEFLWPSLRIHQTKLQKKILSKKKTKRRKRRGLFVFPLQSRITGNKYAYLWMSMAKENGWHVLLDASALGSKDMETLGLSIFKPDFLICSFFKVFGDNPSGFGCLFVKKSTCSILTDSDSIGIVRIVPAMTPTQLSHNSSTKSSDSNEVKQSNFKQKSPQIEEFNTAKNTEFQFKFKGLDHADSLGLILISNRARYLINWLVNALMSLQHPHGQPAIKIYGPKIKFNRGPAVAFNVFDWKGEKISPVLVQKLADRNNISLSCGVLLHILIPDRYEELKEEKFEGLNGKKREIKRQECGISVVTGSLGLLTNFEDVYKVWVFVSRFLDADFVEKERWRYTALNQKTIEV